MYQKFTKTRTIEQWRRPFKNNVAIPKSQRSKKNTIQRAFLLFVALCVSMATTFAQDVITLKNGTDIQALVLEVGEVDVKYKKFDNPNGPNYTLKKSEIFMIKYVNGSKDVFIDSSLPTTKSNSNQQNNSNQSNIQSQDELLYITKSTFSGIKVKNSSGVTLLGNEITSTLASVPEALQLYNNGVTLKGVGTGFGIAGMVFLCIGVYSGSSSNYTYIPWGWYIGGVLCTIPQLILINSGNSKIDSAIGVYNSSIQRQNKSDLSLAFGITQSGGIGFTLNF